MTVRVTPKELSTLAAAVADAPAKADAADLTGRFREIVSDPLNLLIWRHPRAGLVDPDGRVVLHNGLRVPLAGRDSYYGEFSTVLALNRGVHEPLEEFVFQELLGRLPEAPAMLELGAYWAHYAMWLKRARPGARVVMVEPDEAGLRCGRANFEANGLEGEFIQARVSDGEFGVDRFLDGGDRPRLAILHADIQGAEVDMLRGCRRALSEERIDYLFVSTHSDALHHETEALIRAAGYRVEVSSDFGSHSTAHDGLVFASRASLPPLLPGFRPLGRAELAGASPHDLVTFLVRSLGDRP